MIHCHDVVKRYKSKAALDHVSLEITSGICAVLGPNGAGKSTLLGVLSGLVPPDEGEVRVASFDVRSELSRLKQHIGVLPENLALIDALTVEEHLELSGAVYGTEKHETRKRADTLLRLLKLDDGRATFASQCSFGMRKKTALAMALLHNPRVLLLDEPFEGVDPTSSLTIQHLLTTAAQRGLTVLLTSHMLYTVERLTSQIVMMDGGRMVWNSSEHTRDEAKSLEQHYLALVDEPLTEDVAWLGH
jgi:ABC-2 type transport system ATP-binding protein